MAIIFTIAILETSVSLKYEVDEGYIALDMNKSLSPEKKKERILELESQGKILRARLYFLFGGAIASFLTATGLVIYSRKLVAVKTRF